jgi:hypothetical protein
MQSAYEVAIEKLEALEPILRITHPDGRYWKQPDRSKIVVDDTHALMSRPTFDALLEYSGSQPTGAYEGKMWKRNNGACDWEFLAQGGKPEWWLCWYGPSTKGQEYVSTFHRKILIA